MAVELLNVQLMYCPIIEAIWWWGSRGMNDAGSVAKFAHKCILEHSSLFGTLVGTKVR